MTALSLPRPRRIRPAAILVAALVVVAASQLATFLRPASPPSTGPAPVTISAPLDLPGAPIPATGGLRQIDHSIAAWTANLAANDKDFISAATLGVLYESRARLSGDISDYTRAADAATRSLAIEPRQLDVKALHARLLLATHDFSGALTEAETVDKAAPDQPAVLSIMGDAQLELGRVDEAAALYGRIDTLTDGPAVSARLARLAFIRGDPSAAIKLAESAHAAASAQGLDGPSLSWYAYLAGTMSLASGAPESAATWYDRAVTAWPASFLALAGRARVDATLGRTDAAIAGYKAAIAIAPQPEALTALGDLLALQGDTAGAEQQYATVLAIAQLQGSGGLVYNRQLVLFDVNHGRDAAAALTLAERELSERKDAYGYDAYAWALLANDRAADADAAMVQARAFGTQDATLLYHAGQIALALGDTGRARDLLDQALAIRGGLDPLAASRAAASRDSLR